MAHDDPEQSPNAPARPTPPGEPRSDAFATDETLLPGSTPAPGSSALDSMVSGETLAPDSGADFGTAETVTPSSAGGAAGVSQAGVDLTPGSRAGEYVVDRLIGEGGFGRVYAGVHPVIGKAVAIKVLHVRYSADPDIVSRFIAEARAVNQIGHEGIIDIFAFGTLPDGRHYYVMELLEGITLRRLIKQRGRIGLAETIDLLRQVGGALDAAHAAGVAHRDFKPDNIFLTPRGERFRVKLLDFGVAKLMDPDSNVDHRTATGASVGTPAYMAPEQVIGKHVDHRADIYAFGVVAFHMLTGKLPFEADSAFSVMTAHVNEPPPDPASLVADLPSGLGAVLGWALAKAPADRPPDCAAFIDRLEDLLRDPAGAAASAEEAPAPTIDVPVAAPGGARRGVVPLLVGLALLLGAGAWFIFGSSASDGGDPPTAREGALTAPTPPPATAVPPPMPDARPVDAAPDATPPDAAPPDAALPAQVEVTIAGLPARARVLGPGGVELRVGPGPVQLDRGADPVELSFEASGFLPLSQAVVPNRDQQVTVALAPRPARPAPVRPTPRPTKPPEPKRTDPVSPDDLSKF